MHRNGAIWTRFFYKCEQTDANRNTMYPYGPALSTFSPTLVFYILPFTTPESQHFRILSNANFQPGMDTGQHPTKITNICSPYY